MADSIKIGDRQLPYVLELRFDFDEELTLTDKQKIEMSKEIITCIERMVLPNFGHIIMHEFEVYKREIEEDFGTEH